MASSREMSPASSQLSSHGSSEFGDNMKAEDGDQMNAHLMPPMKRRRYNSSRHNANHAASQHTTPMSHLEQLPVQDDGYISSDTDGSIPPSPGAPGPSMGGPGSAGASSGSAAAALIEDEDPRYHVQVHVCRWDTCTAGDLDTMDGLVNHLHDDHLGTKETNYACEWLECPRKGTPHASAYALKAHLRSHTKEKPFYCVLPECDRSFTRSDALTKHMRSVHEIDTMRPSDHSTRSNTANAKPQRLKLIVNSKPPTGITGITFDEEATLSPGTLTEDGTIYYEYPADVNFSETELALPPRELYRLLRRQVHWSLQNGEALEAEVEDLERMRKEEWIAKELVLANLMEAELAVAHTNGESEANVARVLADLPTTPLPLKGQDVPWYRQVEVERFPHSP